MQKVELNWNPELTRDQLREACDKAFAGKYQVKKWPFGGVMVSKGLLGVNVYLRQTRNETFLQTQPMVSSFPLAILTAGLISIIVMSVLPAAKALEKDIAETLDKSMF